ncbi:MAG: VOC family protein [Saprospiraceae bacterium]|nr:VOC family protein [Saprospiraceae bacterium]
MSKPVFINLPVKNLAQTNAFFTALGFSFNPQFSDEKATCMLINELAFAMLLSEPFFKGFTPKAIADATQTTEVLIALSTDSRDAVDEMVQQAIAAGGSEARPAEDLGFMYHRAFNDLDGHIWEVTWMDPAGMPQQ